MPRPLRSEIYSPSEVSILHVCQRCVRRAYLSGVDDFSGKDTPTEKSGFDNALKNLPPSSPSMF